MLITQILFMLLLTGSVIKAWDIGVATMKKGEICKLTCRSDYAYGKSGSPPLIGPDSTLIFEVCYSYLYYFNNNYTPTHKRFCVCVWITLIPNWVNWVVKHI